MSEEYFKQAELALAAYANLEAGVNVAAELQATDFSTTQANFFIDKYEVVGQHTDATGLSATVFKSTGDNPQTYLAVRGTDDLLDFLTDVIDISLIGGTTQQQQYINLKAKVTEWMNNDILPESFTVTGHSLGGFLATGIATDFTNNVSHAYLYNAPGLTGAGNNFANAITFLAEFYQLSRVPDPSNFSNIKEEAGISPIAGLGYQVAPPIDILIEDQTNQDTSNTRPAALNHNQQVLTDALSVYSLYSQLLPGHSTEQLSEIIDAFGSTEDGGISNSKTLESALGATDSGGSFLSFHN